MDLFYNRNMSEKPILKISVDDIEYYASQLSELIRLYQKHIYIPDEESQKIVSELEYLATLLVNREYASLITNANELITNDLDETVPF